MSHTDGIDRIRFSSDSWGIARSRKLIGPGSFLPTWDQKEIIIIYQFKTILLTKGIEAGHPALQVSDVAFAQLRFGYQPE